MRKLLLLEDDVEFLGEMRQYFQPYYEVRCAGSVGEAVRLLEKWKPDAAVLDLMLPDGRGTELLAGKLLACPAVILTRLTGDENEIDALDAGAVDYLVKPCSLKVLARHVTLRLSDSGSSMLKFGSFTVDAVNRVVFCKNKPVKLTASEFNILCFLAANPGVTFSAEEIYRAVYDMPFLQSTTIRRHLSTLRRKLDQFAPNKNYIRTETGNGYRFHKETGK